jgi:hypothetical protein
MFQYRFWYPPWTPPAEYPPSFLNLPFRGQFADSSRSNQISIRERGYAMGQSIRVVVANQPRLMRELVLETITGLPDIEIVAEIQDQDQIVDIVDGTHPDFLIIALDEPNRRPALCDMLLRRYPELKILALAHERNICTYFWASFEIHSTQVEASEAGILSALRQRGQYVA